MLSGFCCPCHGPMALTPELVSLYPNVAVSTPDSSNAFPNGHSFVTIDVGKAGDGYWTSADLDDQLLHRAIPIFNILHPDCEGLWLFDNSQNHRARAVDALQTTTLNLNDGGKNAKEMHPTWYVSASGERKEQLMVHPNGVREVCWKSEGFGFLVCNFQPRVRSWRSSLTSKPSKANSQSACRKLDSTISCFPSFTANSTLSKTCGGE